MSMAEKIDKMEELVKKMEINHKSDSSDLKVLQNLIKEVRKSPEFKKKNTKKSDSDSNEVKKTYGITEPKLLPPNVYKFIEEAIANKKLSEDFITSNEIFVNFTNTTLVARTKVNSIIHNYIKTNNLYADQDKRSIYKPDNKLKELFQMSDEENLNLKNIQTFLKRAYDKFKSDDKDKSSSSDDDKKVTKVTKVKKVKKVEKKEVKEVKEDEDEEEDDESE
jgi:hypothetical protein